MPAAMPVPKPVHITEITSIPISTIEPKDTGKPESAGAPTPLPKVA